MISLIEKSNNLLEELLVDSYEKYDLSGFNDIISSRRYLPRRANIKSLSGPIAANRFDFMNGSLQYSGVKILNIDIHQRRCIGVAQWMRLNLAEGVSFENYPEVTRTEDHKLPFP